LPPTRLLLSTGTDTSNSERKEKVALDRQQFKQKREKEKRKMERVQKRRQEQRQMLQEKRETTIGIPVLPESLLLNISKSPVLVRSKEYGFSKRGAEGCNNGGSSRRARRRVEEKKSLARISSRDAYGSLEGGRSTTPTAFCNRHPRAKCQQFLWHTASQSADTHCLAW